MEDWGEQLQQMGIIEDEGRTELFFYSLVPPGSGGCLLGIAAFFGGGREILYTATANFV